MIYLVLVYGPEAVSRRAAGAGSHDDLPGVDGTTVLAAEALTGSASHQAVGEPAVGPPDAPGPAAPVNGREGAAGSGGPGDAVLTRLYVIEAATLDEAIEVARRAPSVDRDGAVEIRPMVEWFDRATGAAGAAGPDGGQPPRYLATIHGREGEADAPGTAAWDEGAAQHRRFVEGAGGVVVAGGAVHPVATATTLRVRDGELLVTDGPYAETAEVVGGFYLLQGPPGEVLAIADRVPLPEEGGWVAVRPVAPVERARG